MSTSSTRPETLTRFAHLFALSGLSLAGPLLNILADGPEFFVNRRALPLDIVALVAILMLAVPLALFTIESLVRLFNIRAASIMHHVCIAGLVALAVVPLLVALDLLPGYGCIGVGCVIGAIVAILAARFKGARQWLAFLSVLPIFSLASFVMSEGVSTLLAPPKLIQGDGFTKSSDTPVAILVFDEFPLNGLLNQNLEIEPERFPNFAALAKDATWYRNATAVNAFTPIALPAILSGKMPKTLKALPTTESYPANLFTILARSHAISTSEPFTRLCPPEICGQSKRRSSVRKRVSFMLSDLVAVYLNYIVPNDVDLGVPSIDGKWGDFWDEKQDSWSAPNFARKSRVGTLKAFLSAIKVPRDKPAFIFAHTILPHMPHQFTPSGRMYFSGPLHGYIKDRWTEEPAFLQAGYQQFLFQLGATDYVLGLFINKLKELGIYEKALIVVAADHGFSMRPTSYRRGDIDEAAFYEDIMNVPLFIKYPGASQGRIDLRHAQNNDVLPTVLDVLGLDYDLELDGYSLLRNDRPDRTEQQFLVGRVDNPGRRKGKEIKVKKVVKAEGEIRSYKVPPESPRATVDWKYTLQGYATQNPHNRYFLGPYAALLGRSVAEFPMTTSKSSYVVLSCGDRAKSGDWSRTVRYDPKTGVCPCNIQGNVDGLDSKPGDIVGVAINGVFESFANLIDGPDKVMQFIFLLPDSAFKPGDNSIQLYKIEPGKEALPTVRALTPRSQ